MDYLTNLHKNFIKIHFQDKKTEAFRLEPTYLDLKASKQWSSTRKSVSKISSLKSFVVQSKEKEKDIVAAEPLMIQLNFGL